MTHETKWRLYEHSKRLLDELRAGKKLDPHARRWAEHNVRVNAPRDQDGECAQPVDNFSPEADK